MLALHAPAWDDKGSTSVFRKQQITLCLPCLHTIWEMRNSDVLVALWVTKTLACSVAAQAAPSRFDPTEAAGPGFRSATRGAFGGLRTLRREVKFLDPQVTNCSEGVSPPRVRLSIKNESVGSEDDQIPL